MCASVRTCGTENAASVWAGDASSPLQPFQLQEAVPVPCELNVPNAQLRILNPQVNSTLRGLGCVLPVQLAALPLMSGGGVSSFGYSGTIAHAVLRRAAGGKGLEALSIAPVVYKWQSFPWFEHKSATAAPAVAVFATCWAAHQDLARQTSRLDSVLLFCGMQAVSGFDRRSKESAGDPSSVPRASSPRRAAVLLLPACSSVAPATGQQHMALVLVQHQASLPLLILTQGAYTSIIHSPAASAASGGSWGMARVVRLEQPSRHVLTIDVSLMAISAVHWAAGRAMELGSEVEMAQEGQTPSMPRLRQSGVLTSTLS